MSGRKVIETGIRSLDLLLGGGIPERQSIIVTGAPGTGKTILGSQVAFAHAARGDRVVLATIASEAHEKLIDDLADFSFFDRDRIGRELYLVSAYPWLQKGPREAKDALLKAVHDRNARLLFIDGLRSVRDLWQSEAKLRDFLYELGVGLAQMDAIGLFTTEYRLERLMELPEATTVDGVIALSTQRWAGRVVRRAQVAKLRGRHHVAGEHLLEISRDGISITPRLEEVTTPDSAFTPTTKRADFGVPELDELLRGGLPAQGATLLAGSTGVGKTLLALHFAATGARRGEPGLYISYSEPVARLIARATGIGLDLPPLVEDRALHVEYRSALARECDRLASDVLDRVVACGARRVVIDGVGELEHSILEKERVRDLMTALSVQLRDRGVTTIFVKEVPKIAGPDLDLSDTPSAVTAENVMFLRHIELRGRLHRILSILKMRDSGYDPYMRDLEIDSDGIRLRGPVASAEGLLAGVARPVPYSPEPDRSR